ncbi:MarR family winged helix-turn-helix transcriptional regulator [Rhodococcus sp. P1Y]|uniref:MarR family winged helix-turn-helix transcriptional regulator n=1 Tax=Rhodococcus sp. P1Y TaxID=1302308 RepID=UPI000EB29502|nr:MarR family transcriptional regulator [Rhodococcus sp. P1Y]AYJ47655.1 MarR family transcriptional regulator [Rhodococcus sp. P1Y]
MGKKLTVDGIVELLPDWGHSIAQLNAVIAERLGVSVRDLDALHALVRLGPATAKALGERVGLTSGSASRMIDRLDGAGLVERVRDNEDRRRVVIAATAEGLQHAGAYYLELTRATRRDLSDFTVPELETIEKFLTRSTASTSAELDRLRSE